ncbi:hypothetical protein ACQP00_29170 [Dactylosporangium sp. CS-047395]|uniref:hypothetical protein n=1 Tax=Dactylosporangium sp. CS-047395 TaxID=3239936 RepID=UPI003D8CDAFB
MLNLNPDTIARYANATTVEELLTARNQSSKLDPFKPYLDQRWNDGCIGAVQLTHEIRELGYHGTDRTVRRYLEPLRASGRAAINPWRRRSATWSPGLPGTPTT